MSTSIATIVYARVAPLPRRRWVLAVLFALTAHLGVVAFAMRSRSTLEFWAMGLATLVHAELVNTREVMLLAEPPPPAEPEPPPAPPPPRAPPPVAARAAGPRAPAQAGQAITREPTDAPADLTGSVLVTGEAQVYAGGATSAAGKSTTFVPSDAPLTNQGLTAPGQAQPIALADEDWKCPWPSQADLAEVDHQSAIVRVTVGTDGRARRAQIVRDPGLGFGAAAAECAMRARFVPARDANGRPVEAESAIRVRFER